jgi:hypothetical protein
MNFNIQTTAMFEFFVLDKNGHPLNIYQYTKFHGPALTGASFASTSGV